MLNVVRVDKIEFDMTEDELVNASNLQVLKRETHFTKV